MSVVSVFTAIADAIREKNGSESAYTPGQMPTAIRNIGEGAETDVFTFTSFSDAFSEIADAIREKTGESGLLTPSQMAGAIEDIPTAPAEIKARAYLEDTLTEYTDQNGLANVPVFALTGLTQIETLNMPDLEFENGIIPDYYFSYMPKLKNLTLSYGSSSEGLRFDGVTAIGNYAFSHFKSNAETLAWMDFIFPDCTTVGDFAFYDIGRINLDMPKVTAYGEKSFNTNYVKVLKLPKITSCTGGNAFRYSCALEAWIMSGLTGAVSPLNYVTSDTKATLKVLDIGKTTRLNVSFRDFTLVETVVMRSATRVTFNASSTYSLGLFAANGPFFNGAGRIYVPSALLESYRTAAGWSTFASYLVAIEGSEWEIAE